MVSMATGTFETRIRMKKGQAFLHHVLADAADSSFSVIQLTDITDGRWGGSELEQVHLPSLFYPPLALHPLIKQACIGDDDLS